MYLERLHLNHSPFQEEPDPRFFFPGAGRETTLQSVVLDILGKKRLIKLIGREGSGKTLLCRMIIEQLPDEYEVVYLTHPIGSFDDLLRSACLDMGMDPNVRHDTTRYSDELLHLLHLRQEKQKKVVLIIDEAEKLFMATLERLVRNLGSMPNIEGLNILLAGRPGLDINLEQLAILCDQIDIRTHYELDDLTENETREYLRFRLSAAGLPQEGFDELFPDNIVRKIFASAQGNLRMTNILAEESLQTSCSDKSFMVLLDHVNPETDAPAKIHNQLFTYYQTIRSSKRLLGIGLGGCVFLVLLILVNIRLLGCGVELSPHLTEP